jgi:hypothetical protein
MQFVLPQQGITVIGTLCGAYPKKKKKKKNALVSVFHSHKRGS